MYCKNCGNEMKDTMKFCPKCGTKIITQEISDEFLKEAEETVPPVHINSIVGSTQNNDYSETMRIKENDEYEFQKNKAKTEKKKRKGKGKFVAIVLVLLVLIGGVMGGAYYWYVNQSVTINAFEEDADKYFKASGISGKGTVSIDTDIMLDNLFDRIDQEMDNKGKKRELKIAKEAMSFELSSDSSIDNLSNGDEITVEFVSDESANKSAGITMDNLSYTYTVSGLQEVQLLDIFKDIQITSKTEKQWGREYTSYEVVNNSENSIIKNFKYEVNEMGSGMFRVTCNVKEEDLNTLGYGIDMSDTTICEDEDGFYKLYLADSIVDITPTSEETTNSDGKIGSIHCNVNLLNIRSTPSTSGSKLGKLNTGDTRDVYEKTTSEGYTWYRIGNGEWVADNGTWLTYNEN